MRWCNCIILYTIFFMHDTISECMSLLLDVCHAIWIMTFLDLLKNNVNSYHTNQDFNFTGDNFNI